MIFQRDPRPALRPFVKALWAADRTAPPAGRSPGRERVLPTGDTHIAFRLSDQPVCLFDSPNAPDGRRIGQAVVGGARGAFYVRDTAPAGRTVGVQLHAGAAQVLFGFPADALAGRHTPLEELWGRSAARVRERLQEASGLAEQLDILESVLAERLPRVRGVHPAVAQALASFRATPSVGAAVRESGYSHRRFKVYTNVRHPGPPAVGPDLCHNPPARR
jgi:hypothetical protein